MTEDQKIGQATAELVKELKGLAAMYFIQRKEMIPNMELILTSALMATLCDSIALSISTRTAFMPSDEETNQFISQFQSALGDGVKSYLEAWAEQQEKIEELAAGGSKPTEN